MNRSSASVWKRSRVHGDALASYSIRWWWRQWLKPGRWCPRRGRLPWTRPDGPGSPSQGWPAHLVTKRRETSDGMFHVSVRRRKWPHVLLRRSIKLIKRCHWKKKAFSALVILWQTNWAERPWNSKQRVTEAWICHLIEPNLHHPSSPLIPPFLSSLCPRCLLRFMLHKHLLLCAVWE